MPHGLAGRTELVFIESDGGAATHSPRTPEPSAPEAIQARRREVLRQASIVLQHQVVTLWEVSAQAEVVAVVTSVAEPPYHATALDLDATLRSWQIPIIEGSRWVGCHLAGGWRLAPVRTQPPAPPPGPERRCRERLALELAGLCLGLVDPPAAARPRLPEPDALLELSRQPSVIAHEVANPLTAALVSLDLTQDEIRAASPMSDAVRATLLDHLGDVEAGVDRAMAFLRAMQDRARGALARLERFDAARVVRACVTLERPLARQQGVSLQDEIWASDVFLQGDPNALYRLLTNLIRNAVTASREGKRPILVEQVRRGPTLLLTVRDQGVGIPAEHLDRIFDPGFTTQQLGTGSGTGLPVVRDTAERMFGGAVKVESTVGAGTTVTVSLPIPPQRTAPRGRRAPDQAA